MDTAGSKLTQKRKRSEATEARSVRLLYREGGEAMGAAVVEGDPLAGFGVLPDDEVAVEELERGGEAGVEVLDEGDGVPVIPPHELLAGLRRRRARLRLLRRPLRLPGDGRRRGHAEVGARTADVAGGRERGEGGETRPVARRQRPRGEEEGGRRNRYGHLLRLV